MSLLYVLLGAALLAAVVQRSRRRFGNKNSAMERRKPGVEPVETLRERRKDDEVGGEA